MEYCNRIWNRFYFIEQKTPSCDVSILSEVVVLENPTKRDPFPWMRKVFSNYSDNCVPFRPFRDKVLNNSDLLLFIFGYLTLDEDTTSFQNFSRYEIMILSP